MSFNYFRALTLLNQPGLSDEFAVFYRKKGWDEAITLGDQMFALLKTKRPGTPEEEIKVFVACANVLFKQNRTFNAKESKLESLGYLKLRWVDIDMMPISSCASPIPANG
jgi:hypothetical protein